MPYIITNGTQYCHQTKNRAVLVVDESESATFFKTEEAAQKLLARATKKLKGFEIVELTENAAEADTDQANVSASPEVSATPQEPVTEVVAEETVADETPAVAEETVITEAPAAEETASAEAPEKKAPAKRTRRRRTSSRTKKTVETVETPAVDEETVVAEAPAVTEETVVTEAPAVTEETVVTEAPAVTEETVATEVTDQETTAEQAEAEAPARPHRSRRRRRPRRRSNANTESAAAADVSNVEVAEPYVAEDMQAAPEAPVVVEAPAQVAAPVVTEAPAQVAAPVVNEAPAQVAVPVVNEAPAPAAAPVVNEAPAQTEAPAQETTQVSSNSRRRRSRSSRSRNRYRQENAEQTVEITSASSAPAIVEEVPVAEDRTGGRNRGRNRKPLSATAARRRLFTTQERNAVYNSTEGHCGICGRFIPLEEYTVDHIIPLSKGGTNDLDNLQPCCGFCNKAKDDTMGDDFFNRIERIFTYQAELKYGKKKSKKLKKFLKELDKKKD